MTFINSPKYGILLKNYLMKTNIQHRTPPPKVFEINAISRNPTLYNKKPTKSLQKHPKTSIREILQLYRI